MIEFFKNILTARDNSTFSLSKLLAISAVCAMVFNFVKLVSADYQGLGIGVSIMIAALAGKYYVEDKEK
jgi:hypothetical protein